MDRRCGPGVLCFASEIGRDDGALELTFGNGTVLLLDVGADGEALRVSTTPWVDGFEAHPTPENLEFVRTHGKWTRFAVSGDAGYRDLVGRRVDGVETVLSPEGKIIGAVFRVGEWTLRAEVAFDEVHVRVA